MYQVPVRASQTDLSSSNSGVNSPGKGMTLSLVVDYAPSVYVI